MSKKPTALPPIELVELDFAYDPETGAITKRGKVLRNNDRTSSSIKVRVGNRTVSAQRLAWLLFYREDPINKQIRHINGNPFDNRITNLRAFKISKR